MNEYPGYKNPATWVASVCLGESIQKLREDYPKMTVLDVKMECLEFLLNQFKPHSLKMNGESDWVFINSGFPMNRAKGKSARDAVISAMEAK